MFHGSSRLVFTIFFSALMPFFSFLLARCLCVRAERKKQICLRVSPHRITPINGERVEKAETFEKYEIGIRRRKGEKERKKRQGERGKRNKKQGVTDHQVYTQKCCYGANVVPEQLLSCSFRMRLGR